MMYPPVAISTALTLALFSVTTGAMLMDDIHTADCAIFGTSREGMCSCHQYITTTTTLPKSLLLIALR